MLLGMSPKDCIKPVWLSLAQQLIKLNAKLKYVTSAKMHSQKRQTEEQAEMLVPPLPAELKSGLINSVIFHCLKCR